MESLFIEGTKKTPEVNFNANGIVSLKGRSIPEDPSKYFDVLHTWALNYSTSPQTKTQVNIELEYFNSGTSKSLLHILRVFTDMKHKGLDVEIRWIYECGDDDIYERGEYYSNILDATFTFIETPNE